MSMFQKSVLNSVSQDESKVALRWAEYKKYLSKIDFIRSVKEEKYQDGFLKDIFENCLGYTLDSTNPDDFNLEREKKNETDGKKADGVIYINSEVVGIIELKAQDTKNLDKIEAQAFNYHNSHSNSKYIIISNFDELRLYIDKKTAYEKFSLFNLNYEEFKKLHLLLSYESIKDNIPQKLKDKSASFEQDISKNLYKDFSAFRTHLFENLVKNNSLDKALLLRLTQKLCDRIIFILFAEDRGLLTANTIKEIRERHQSDGFGDRTMYDYYKLYFDAINKGNERLNIPKYNGGLFGVDETLDSLIIDDNILDLEAQTLSDYDFMSDVSVNILGHIFEQSLTDLEEINASINKTEFDNKKSKRKKDGVFYTPEYITKYIVDNTLGNLCNNKKEELKLTEITAPKNSKKPTKKEQIQKDNLEEYRTWLLNLKILDPACGSGAFLNQALDFLISEHQSLQKNLVVMGDITAYYEIEKSILENNLYGVDINEDAVEIAKLSLWLRTASKGRELTKLADKIKCGNSLIDDKSVVDNAFVWEEEFSEVFGKVLIDTNVIIDNFENTTNSNVENVEAVKQMINLFSQKKINLCIASRVLVEINNKKIQEQVNLMECLEIKNSCLVLDVSPFDLDEFATEEDQLMLTRIEEIMRGDKKKKQFNDASILLAACKHKLPYVVSNNTSEFGGKRKEKLEQLTGLKICSPSEFIKLYKTNQYKKGFDVIIGNPPYIPAESIENSIKKLLLDKYISADGRINLYIVFYELGLKLLNANGVLGFITPYTLLKNQYYSSLRQYILKNYSINEIVDFSNIKIFEDATVDSIMLFISKKALNNNIIYINSIEDFENKQYISNSIEQRKFLKNNDFSFHFNDNEFIDKILLDNKKLKSIVNFNQGIITGNNKELLHNEQNIDDVKIIKGADFNRYFLSFNNTYLDYTSKKIHRRRKKEIFETKKLLLRQTGSYPIVAIDNFKFYTLDTVHNGLLINDNYFLEFIMTLLNSKLLKFIYESSIKEQGKTFAQVKIIYIDELPIKETPKNNQYIYLEKSNLMLEFNKNLHQAKENFLNELELEKIPKKLQNFEELEFDEFVKEYKKAKKLKFADKLEERNFKNEWKALFENDKKIALDLKLQINATDTEIDKMVYELYGLSDDEIKIVEGI